MEPQKEVIFFIEERALGELSRTDRKKAEIYEQFTKQIWGVRWQFSNSWICIMETGVPEKYSWLAQADWIL